MNYMAHELDALGGCTGLGGWLNVLAAVLLAAGLVLLVKALRLCARGEAKATLERVFRWMVVPLLIGLGAARPAAAASAPVNPREERFTATVALAYEVPRESLTRLRSRGTGWDDIAQALVLAKKTGKPLRVIIWLRDSGHSWDEIARRFSLEPRDVNSEAQQLARLAPR